MKLTVMSGPVYSQINGPEQDIVIFLSHIVPIKNLTLIDAATGNRLVLSNEEVLKMVAEANKKGGK